MKKLLSMILVICLMACVFPVTVASGQPVLREVEDLFNVTLPANLVFDGNIKEITVTPKAGITGTGTVTVSYGKGIYVADPITPGTYNSFISMSATSEYEEIVEETKSDWDFTIVPGPVTITGLTVSKEYDGTTEAINSFQGEATLSGVSSNYQVRLGGNLTAAEFDSADAGDNKKVTLTGLELEKIAADVDNTGCYTLSPVITGTITAKPVTITAKNQTAELGAEITRGTDQVEVSGLLAGHKLSSIGLVADTNSPTDSGTIEPVSAKIVDANDQDVTKNYSISYVNGTLTVNAPPPVERVVTFQVENGFWDDGTTKDISATLTGINGEPPKLTANDIPAVGTKPDNGFKAGSWDPEPVAGTELGEDKKYIYTYAQKQSISATVTFKVSGGSWDDGTAEDKTVTLTGLEGDTLKLAAGDIPAAGTKPGDGFKAGGWDTAPSADAAITADTTYTYTYTQKQSISATVTFKVANGSWDDGTAEAKTVTLTGYEGDALKLAAGDIPAIGTKPGDGFKAGGWDTAPSADAAITADTTYTYTYAQKEKISATVTFKVANGSWDDGTAEAKTVTLTGLEGDTLKLAAGDIPAAGTKPNDGFKAGTWDTAPSADTAITADTTYTYTYAQKERISATVTFKVANGSWDDGTAEAKTVTLTGLEGDSLKLAAGDIPAVGTKPGDGFKAGAWDTAPSTDTAIEAGSATTCTYTYAQKESISATVTLKVANGSWDDGTTEDKTVTLTGLEGDALVLAAGDIPAAGTNPGEGFKAGSWSPALLADAAFEAGSATIYTYTYAEKEKISATVTFKVANGSWDDGTAEDKTVALTGLEGETLTLTAGDIPAVGNNPGEGYKAGGWNPALLADAEITADTTYTYTYMPDGTVSATVTFRVANGSWDDGTAEDKSVTLTGPEGEPLTLAAGDIPAVGNNPGEGYKAGSWDAAPSTETEITGDTAYTYTYAQKESISATVTFRVANGSWDDGTAEDKTVTLTGLEGDTLKLATGDIPAAGANPGEGYKAGSWNPVPSAETEMTADTAYTYTYIPEGSVSATVTFRVVNGAWDDGTTADKTVMLVGPEGEPLTLAAGEIPAVGTNPGEGFKAGGWSPALLADAAFEAGSATTYTYTYAQKESISATITFHVANGSWDDGTTEDKTVTLTGFEGDPLKLAAGDIPAVGGKPDERFKPGGWSPAPPVNAEITEDTTFTYTYAERGKISATVTFRVLNGSWDDGTTEDKSVTLTGLEGDSLKLSAGKIPAAGANPSDGFKAGSWDPVLPADETFAARSEMIYTYHYVETEAEQTTITITFRVVGGFWDDETRADKTVKLTGYDYEIWRQAVQAIPAVGRYPNSLFIAGEWSTVIPSTTYMPSDHDVYIYTYKADGIPISEDGSIVVCGLEESYDYAGGASIKPSFCVVDEYRGVVLSKSKDYTVKYSNNKKVGTATITVTGKGNYAGKNETVTFEIVDPTEHGTLVSSKVKKITLSQKTFTYNGLPQYPEKVTIVLKDKTTLIATYDGAGGYDVTDAVDGTVAETVVIKVCNNVECGSATLAVGTQGNNWKKISFKIRKASLSFLQLPDDIENVYSAKELMPDGFTVPWENGDGEEVELIQGQDFTAKFKFPEGSGTGEITLTGKGNFTGKTYGTFKVNAFEPDGIDVVDARAEKSVKNIQVTIMDPLGNPLSTKKLLNVKVLDAEGKELDRDYILKAGDKITVVVTSKDPSIVNINDDGLTETLTVGTAFSKATISKNGLTKTYTGEPIELTEEDMGNIAVTIKINKVKTTLTYGVDYVIAGYQNNIKTGNMVVYLQGIGEYSGIKTFKVKIVGKSVKKSVQ